MSQVGLHEITRVEGEQKTMRRIVLALVAVICLVSVAACKKKTPPVVRPTPPPAGSSTTGGRPPAPPEPVNEPTVVPPEPVRDERIASASLDDINKNSPLKPVFFEYDSDELSPLAQKTLEENAGVLKTYPTWTVTIEGHCDERGTPEYNLALGERRAVTARAYLVSLGVAADRLRTVSYGREFPFDPAHTEAAFSLNRRAHFVITAK
jgi:peptidoglycan-associated lipoprotein